MIICLKTNCEGLEGCLLLFLPEFESQFRQSLGESWASLHVVRDGNEPRDLLHE